MRGSSGGVGNLGSMTISGATIANNQGWCAAPSPATPHARVALRGSDTSVAGVRGSTAPACTDWPMTISGATIANNSALLCAAPSTAAPHARPLRGSDTSVAGVCAAGAAAACSTDAL